MGSRSPRVRCAAASRRLVPALLALVLMSAASGCARGSSAPATPPAGAAAIRTPAPQLADGVLVVTHRAAAGPVAVDARNLVWESGPLEAETLLPSIHDRDLATGVTRTFAGTVDPLFGLASTARSVFFARSSRNATTVVRTSHRGTDARVLSEDLVTPIASRGSVVAWGEQSGPSERVVAYTGTRRWIVAKMPRCTTNGCYRLGDVTVAKDGIVFTRDAVGGQGSFVMRRAFDESKVQSIAVPHDPQPDLAISSSGALYYALFRGWYRWDFGASDPQPVAFANHLAKQLILHEGARWYWLVRHGECSVRIVSSKGGSGAALNVPPRLASFEPGAGRTCTELSVLAWAGNHAIASWAIASEAAEEDHSDAGLRGVVVSARVSQK
jgi:hypothetical protein